MQSQSSLDLPTGTVTFLFTDLQDSTRLWEKHPAIMGQALQRHDEIIESFAGQYNGFLVRPRGEGDSRFAVFVRAIDAVAAAAAIQAALHTEPWPEGLSLFVRMGVHTGEGEFRDGDYYGTAVNRCARLRGIAYGSQTLISQATYELLQDNLPEGIELLDLGQHPLKGLLRPEHIYQLIAPGLPTDFPPLTIHSTISAAPSKLPAFLEIDDKSRAIDRPVFVARKAELKRLNAYLEKALQGQGGIVLITGGAGRGKTALGNEFCWRSLEKSPDLVIAKGNCNAHSGFGDPYLPFIDIFGMLTGDIEAPLASAAITPEYARVLWSILPQTVDAIIKRGASLIDVFVHGESLLARTEMADPDDINRIRRLKALVERKKSIASELEQSLLFEQFTNILLLVSESNPLLLVLDDLQWADNASLDLFSHICRRIEGHPILVVASYRPEEVTIGRDDKRHPLEPIVNQLKRVYGDIIIDLTAGKDNDEADFVDLLIDTESNRLSDEFRLTLKERTAGHPLFTIELLRTMQDRGDLLQDGQGMWVEAEHLDWNKLPARVEAVVEERIGRLEDHLKELLSIASVEGEDFTAQAVARVQEIKERVLLRELSQELEKRHRLIKERGELNIDGRLLSRYRFAHQLYQRYLYNDLSTGERRLLHREIGEVLEELFAGSADEHAVQLAMHFSQAGVEDKALHYLTIAGYQAQSKYAHKEAIDYFTRALSLLPENHPARFELLLSRIKAYEPAGLFSEQGTDAESLLSLAESLDDDTLRVDALLAQADYFLNTEFIHIEEPAKRAIDIARGLGDQVRLAQALYRLGFWAWLRDDMISSRNSLETGYTLFQEAGSPVDAAKCLLVLSLVLGSLNELEAAVDAATKAVAMSRQAGDPRQEATGLRRLAIAHDWNHQHDQALPFAMKALELHRELGDRGEEVQALNVIGFIYGWLKDLDNTERYFRESLALAKAIGQGYGKGAAAGNLCDFYYYPKGEFEALLRFLESELEEAIADEDDLRIWRWHLIKSEVLLLLGQYETSLALLDNIIKEGQDFLSKVDLIRTYKAVSRAQTELGNFSAARQVFDRSLQLSKETGFLIHEGHRYCDLAQICLLEGDRDNLRKVLDQLLDGLDKVRDTKYYYYIVDMLELTARLYLYLEQPEDALKYSLETQDMMEKLPAPIESEVKRYTHARVLYALGRDGEAKEFLQLAFDRVMLVADNTQDDLLRKSWLENVRINRQIIADYHAKIHNPQ